MVVKKAPRSSDAFRVADDVLRQGVQGISDLITVPGLINLDFADVRAIMNERPARRSWASAAPAARTGRRRPPRRPSPARCSRSASRARRASSSTSPAAPDLGLFEVNEAAEIIRETADPEANIIFGTVIDERMGDDVQITVIATGFDAARKTATYLTAATQVDSGVQVGRENRDYLQELQRQRTAAGDRDDLGTEQRGLPRRPWPCRSRPERLERTTRGRGPGHPRLPAAQSLTRRSR